MVGKRKSKTCVHCKHHPTKRVYIKTNGVFRGIAWVCDKCYAFTWDDENRFIMRSGVGATGPDPHST